MNLGVFTSDAMDHNVENCFPISQPEPHKDEGWKYSCASTFSKCIPVRAVIHIISLLLSLAFIYGVVWSLLDKNALPGGAIFALLLLVVCCYIGGRIAEILRLPSLIGMLIVGFLYRNLPFIHFYDDIPSEWSATLRNTALGIILIRAGLGLDPDQLRKMSFVCLRLAFLPCLAETISAGLISRLLFGFPWALCFCLGFIQSATSPAVVVPSMLLLEEKGIGTDKGITTLVAAASSMDDVLAITGFSVCTGIAFSQGNLTWLVLKGPIGVIAGVAYGAITGVLLWYFPHHSEERKVYYRVILLSFGGLAVTFVSKSLDFVSAGAVGCLTIAFVAAFRWRKEEDKNIHVADIENGIWCLLQTFLFGLIGAEVSLFNVQRSVGYAALVLLVGLVFRTLVSYLALFGAGLNFKEKIFVTLAWLAKATVQAAIGSIVLDMAKTTGFGENYILYGEEILTIAVLSILVTAPLGAAAISLLGPVLLKKSTANNETVDSVEGE